MDEQIVGKIFETSIVAGAFIYLLFYVTKNISATLTKISDNMVSFGKSLDKVADTLLKVDTRIGKLEKRIEDLEKGVTK